MQMFTKSGPALCNKALFVFFCVNTLIMTERKTKKKRGFSKQLFLTGMREKP